jgi:hypothetical protein
LVWPTDTTALFLWKRGGWHHLVWAKGKCGHHLLYRSKAYNLPQWYCASWGEQLLAIAKLCQLEMKDWDFKSLAQSRKDVCKYCQGATGPAPKASSISGLGLPR